MGSPPRMRGKQSKFFIVSHLGQDHPRGCGENAELEKFGLAYDGSPPRMRGKQAIRGERIENMRITPADAGKTHEHEV